MAVWRSFRYIIALSIIMVLLMMVVPVSAGAEKMVLASASASHGYKGSSGTITISVKGYKVSVHVSGTDAYDAMAVAIGGVYDDEIHKWRAIAGGHNTKSRDWTGFLGWEGYRFYLVEDKGLFNGDDFIKEESGNWYIFKAGAKVKFKVEHYTWWGLCKEVHYDSYTKQVKVYLPKDSVQD